MKRVAAHSFKTDSERLARRAGGKGWRDPPGKGDTIVWRGDNQTATSVVPKDAITKNGSLNPTPQEVVTAPAITPAQAALFQLYGVGHLPGFFYLM